MRDSFLSEEEIQKMGFKKTGSNLYISRNAQFYSPESIELGSNVRIDDFCILTGNIKIGNNIHISAYTALFGRKGIELMDYSGLSPRCTLFSETDDFSGNYLVGTMARPESRNIIGEKIIIGKFSQIGSSCVILPGVTVHEGVAVGAMSLINHDLESWSIYKGVPAKFHKRRSQKLLDFLSDDD